MVGSIALIGVAAKFSVVMLLFTPDKALAKDQDQEQGRLDTRADLIAVIMTGAVQRLWPKAMSVVTLIADLLPILIFEGVGS